MTQLKVFIDGQRLFTYKVAYDAGTAPNPNGTNCTLAICKPNIRRIANIGDVIVGFGCKSANHTDEEWRIVYCMEVSESFPWEKYIERCNAEDSYKHKIPLSKNDQGDCIWKQASACEDPHPSWSGHNKEDFQRDVKHGENVLIGDIFWYFGKGDMHRIILPEALRCIVPSKQGHRSNANSKNNFREDFVKFFNGELNHRKITKTGVWGTPSIPPESADTRSCSGCRSAEIISDASGEEFSHENQKINQKTEIAPLP